MFVNRLRGSFNPAKIHHESGRRTRGRQRGAALVEFALISPLLFLVLFAIIEFGWTFSQILDTRHGVREAARLAAVDYQPTLDEGVDQTNILVAEVCRRLEDPATSRVQLTFATADTSAGAVATVRVERDLEQLTGFFDNLLSGYEPASQIDFRLERDVSWVATVGEQPCP